MTDATRSTTAEVRTEAEVRDSVTAIVTELAPNPEQTEGAGDSRLVEDLGFHSLALLELAFTLEDEFELPPIDETTARKIVTIDAVAEHVNGHPALARRAGQLTAPSGRAPGAATLRGPAPGDADQRARALSLRLFLAMLHTQELLAGYLGARLGLYEALDRGPADVAEVCARTGVDPRYAREWLEQQAVAGFVEVDDVTAAPERRVYRLPPGHAEVLLASDSPLSLVSLTMLPLGGVAGALPALLEAYRTGAGVPDEVYGDDWRHGHSGANRALFTYSLPGWVSSALPDIHRRLGAAPSRIADIGCGAGWAAIALARAYPLAEVDGYDLDAPTVAAANANAAAAGVADRVRFHRRDAADPELAGRLRRGLRLRRAARDEPTGVGAAGLPAAARARAARCWCSTRRWRTGSSPRATRSSVSSTPPACCTACRPVWPGPTRRPPGRCCGPRRSAGSPPRPASPTCRSCRWTTASTGCTT